MEIEVLPADSEHAFCLKNKFWIVSDASSTIKDNALSIKLKMKLNCAENEEVPEELV